MSDDDKAKIYLQRALKINNAHQTAAKQLANIYLREADYPAAIELLEQCDDYHQLGIAYYHANQLENAQAAFEKALEINSKHEEANHYLATTLLAFGEYDKAITYYLRQLANAAMPETYFNLGCLYMAKDRLADAKSYFLSAQECEPNHLGTQLNLGSLCLKGKDIPTAILHYEKALALKPNDTEIKHILSALKQDQVPDKAPAAYLQHLFDQYADYYDQHLVTCLQYQVPKKLHDALASEIDLTEDLHWKIVDLGCGTGLAGILFKPYASELIGIDISEKMLSLAKEKACYDQLLCDDIENAIDKCHHIDCIIAADVLTYLGDLNPLFSKIHTALKTNGLFLFSVEKTHDDDFKLQQSIRYAHSKSYIAGLIKRHHFKTVRFDNLILRKQHNKPVEGYLVIVQK